VDSVLIDEARTPLIISGAVEHSSHRFDELKGPVQRLVEQQSLLVNRIVADGEVLLEQGKEYEAAVKFLQARRGSPKNNRLLKLEKEKGVFKLIQRAELDYMRDKRLGELDEELYFAIDEKGHVVDLSEKGRNKLAPRDPGLFVLPDLSTGLHQIEGDETLSPGERLERKAKLEQEYVDKSEKLQNISQLLRAYCLFEKDVEYVVSEGKVLIVDEFTGRLMPGRRFSDGLHQALEAKESVAIERETQTLATITVQNYFRLYRKLAGMTGTAETEAGEFWEIYKLDVVVVPTNEPVRRVDCDDVVFKTRREKYNAVIDEIARIHERGLPILVGTVSVDVSETLSRMLQRRGIKHAVLNAKYHQQEAEIVSRAGQAGTVTIATNMAGRGTDIKLGPGVVKSPNCTLIAPPRQGQPCPYYEDLKCDDDVPCGLHIVGTERHEARRIDRQLRGRAGRQGDPGSSRFFLSLEDDLMRLFGSDRIASVMDRLGAKEGEAIEHPLVTRSIGTAQKRVETHNFDIRKHLLEYDDVMNKQREAIYELRGRVLEGEDLKGRIQEMIEDVVDSQLEAFTDPKAYPENWDWANLRLALEKFFLIDLALPQDQRQGLKVEDFREMILERAGRQYETKEQVVGADLMRQLERAVMLQVIDTRWRDHLYAMDLMKEGIGLRAYGQKDPLLEYKQEAYDMFAELTRGLNEDIVGLVYRAQLVRPEEEGRPQAPVRAYKPTIPVPEDAAQREREPVFGRMAARGRDQERGRRREEDAPRLEPVRSEPKVGRNDPCPCGSGKKYKKCCGA
jgi:preprotein translocase subunit SecA